jgi:tetratricopeptide (TPR) repeat protein
VRIAVSLLILLAALPARATAESEALVKAGLAAMDAKKYAEAIQKFEAAVAADPNEALGWYGLGGARRRLGRCEGAIVAYRRFMQLRQGEPDAQYGLGLCLRETGDKAGALVALKAYVKMQTSPEAKRWVDYANGVIAELSASTPAGGPPKPAAATTPPKPVTSPGNAAYVEAQALRDRGRIDDALAKFKKAIADDPQHAAARTALGELLLKIRRDDEAIAAFRATVEKNPSYSLAWYDLAFALRVRGQHAAAVDAYEHYIKLKPGDPDPYYGLGRALQHLGRAADARRAFETYVSLEKRPSERRWIESAETQLRTLASAK